MFNRILKQLSSWYNKKQLIELGKIVDQINLIDTEFEQLSDQQIQNKTQELRKQLDEGKTLDDILPQAFATIKQACKRIQGHEYPVKGETMTRNMVPYDVQLLGGIILHKGTIAEMKTGEGKTLVATLPVYLNALSGNGVHVVTVNDYLASRDAERMGYLYNWLGLSVGCVVKGTPIQSRREQYSRDITYVENSELGFDYLRDNLVKSAKQRNLTTRKLHYAIVDEIDSILIDEARTPLIISEPASEPTEKYMYYAKIVKSLIPAKTKKKVSKWLLHELLNEQYRKQEEDTEGDYYIDEKSKTVQLSSKGIATLEKILKVENIYQELGYEEIHHIENALKAQAVYHKDKEYILKDGEVLIVDEHTGRTMTGRRFSEGLHQAIEAKEGVQIKKESKTLATITYQNFFKQYQKLAGMTGTALTEGEEFAKIYSLEVVEVPTNKDIIRVDKHDKVYFNQEAKRKFVSDYIKFAHEIGQPILIGTSSIQTSEFVSQLLHKHRITHNVLNAKFHEQEADIIAQAGSYKSVVVATNMAGRGTDIKLEKDLNKKLANNYAKRIAEQIEKNEIAAILYSSREYELSISSLQEQFSLSNDQIRSAEKSTTVIRYNNQELLLSITFNTKKKSATDAFAQIVFKNTQHSNVDRIVREFHYGLFVLGTEKHESRRIDNQLRGRAGRQGDAGSSIFFVALDDLIMRKIGGERIQSLAGMMMKKEELLTVELSQKQFTSAITRAQKQIEAMHFWIRKHLFDYDSVIDIQRQKIYTKRDAILESETSPENQTSFIQETKTEIIEYIGDILSKQIKDSQTLNQSTQDMLDVISKEMSIKFDDTIVNKRKNKSPSAIQQELQDYIVTSVESNMQVLSEDKMYLLFKQIYLHYLDKLWIEHLDDMQYLRDKVSLVGYAQQDPLVVYKHQAYDKFQNLLYRFKFDTIAAIMAIDFHKLKEEQEAILQSQQQQQNKQYVQLLQQAASNPELKQIITDNQQNQSTKLNYQDEDGTEVFEINDNNSISTTTVIDTNTKRKLRPNDLVNVKYSNGEIAMNVKYKKVKDDIEKGKASLI
jgi:preprotein translocase subunit SecA